MPYVSDHRYRRLFVDLQASSPSTAVPPASSCKQKKKKMTTTMATKMISVCFSRKSYEVRLWFRFEPEYPLTSRQRFQFQLETQNSDPGLHPPIRLTGPPPSFLLLSRWENFKPLNLPRHPNRRLCGPRGTHVSHFGPFLNARMSWAWPSISPTLGPVIN